MKRLDTPVVVGFWKRLLSDIIDAFFLAIFGAVLCLPFSGIFYAMGQNGLWVGLVVSFFYTGLLQSSLGEGQSLAKKILKIQVLRLDGGYLSLPKSFLRYTLIALIAYNSSFGTVLGLLFPDSEIVDYIFLAFIIILLFGCIFMIPFHPLKRGLHDLIAGSIVVRKGSYTKELMNVEERNPEGVRNAYLLWILSSLIALGVIFITSHTFLKNMGMSFVDLLKTQQAVARSTDLTSVQIKLNIGKNSGNTVKTLIVSGFLEKKKFEDTDYCQAEDQKVIQTVRAVYPRLDQLDRIRVVRRSGLFIGIYSFDMSKSDDFSPDGKKIE